MQGHDELLPGRWDTSAVYRGLGDRRLAGDRAALAELLERFYDDTRSLSSDISQDDFAGHVGAYADLRARFVKLHRYASLLSAEDINSAGVQSFCDAMNVLGVVVELRTTPFLAWWRNLDEVNSERLAGAVPQAAHWLAVQRAHAQFFLSPAREAEIAANIAATYFPLQREYLQVVRTHSYSHNQYDPDPGKRRVAYGEMHFNHLRERERIGGIYLHLTRFRWEEWAGPSGFSSPIGFTNVGHQLSDEVVEQLLCACEENVDLMHQFFGMLGDAIGIENASRTDLTAPVLPEGPAYSFSAAADVVILAFQQADPILGELAARVFRSHHIDAGDRVGKRQVPQCISVLPDIIPFIDIRFKGSEVNLNWLVHELGHAVHFQLAAARGVLEYEAPTPVAEIASIFSELLLMHWRLQRANGARGVQRVLLHHLRELLVPTIIGTAWTRFEIDAHDAILRGCTIDEVSDLYKARVDWAYGPAVNMDDHFRWEWLSNDRFFMEPLSHYAYAFAALIALHLYGSYQEDAAGTMAAFRVVLAAGGSVDPMTLLDESGFSVSDGACWQRGFDVLRRLLDQARWEGAST